MTKYSQSPWSENERHSRFKRKAKGIGAGAVLVLAFLWTAHGEFLDQRDAQEASDAPSEAVEAVAPSYDVPDPCGLTEVVCPGEPEWDSLPMLYTRIQEAAGRAGIDPELAVRVASCESSMDPKAKNPSSSATGLYQFLDSTWEHIGSPGDRLNSDDSIAAFVEWFPKNPQWWEPSMECWINQKNL